MGYSLSSPYCMGDYGPITWGLRLQVTVPDDVKLVFSDGSVVGGEVCVGDTFTLDKGASKGEWWGEGGYDDSPPIYWVDDVEKLTDKIISFHQNTPISLEEMHNAPPVPEGYVDPLTGIPLYPANAEAGYIGYYSLTGNLVCSFKPQNTSASSIPNKGGLYTADKAGNYIIDEQQTVECMFYYYNVNYDTSSYWNDSQHLYTIKTPMLIQNGPNAQSFIGFYNLTDYFNYFKYINGSGDYNYNDTRSILNDSILNNQGWTEYIDYNSKEDFFKVGTIGIHRTIRVVELAKANVEVSIAGAENIKFGESNTLRILVKNTADVAVSIKSVYSNPEGKLISCDSNDLAPGQQAECILSVTPIQDQGLSLQVSYDYKSCGRSQVGLVTKTLIASKTVRPILKEQSYLMGVHGACDNSYYSCYSASEGGLFAGYKCFKTANGFYAPATERFNLKFDLSEIPKDAQIIGATLHLKASEIGKSQTVQVYSVDKIPEAVKCLPGGDICTKPYCGECKPLYDLDGTFASSAEISSTGQYSFGLTNSLKDKSAGYGIVSLQIRGAEGLWEAQGQSSCTVENDWDKRDVSFDAGGREGPYLEIVYR